MRPLHAPARLHLIGALIAALTGSILPAVATSSAPTHPDLGNAAHYSALGGSSLANAGPTTLTGRTGVSPGTTLTGFPPGLSDGAPHANDADAAAAHTDLSTAYTALQNRIPTGTLTGDLAGRTLTVGVYYSAAALTLSGTLTLDAEGDPSALFIIQVDAAFSTAASSRIILAGTAQPDNIYWQVVGAVTLGASSTFAGTVVGAEAVTVGASATVTGRVLAVNGALTLSSNTISLQHPVDLKTATGFSLLAGTSLSNTGTSTFSGNVGVSPGTTLTGFPPGITAGTLHPTDLVAAQAATDLNDAQADIAARTNTSVLPATLNETTLVGGVYTSTGPVGLTTYLTLDGKNNPNSIFILRIEGNLTTGAASQIRLTNRADPNRVFWSVTGNTTLAPSSAFLGTLLTEGPVTVKAGLSLTGRILTTSSITLATVSVRAISPIDIGTAISYSALAATSVNNTGATILNLSVGVSPGTTINGFPPGTITTGALHNGDNDAATARTDAHTAYIDAESRDATAPLDGDLAGLTLHSGIYSAAAAITLSGTLTLDGDNDPNSVFIIQIGAAFSTGSGSTLTLINNAQMDNVFWQVAGAVSLGASSTFVGTIISAAAITIGDTASLTGRVISLNGAIIMSTNGVTSPIAPAGTLTVTTTDSVLGTITLDGSNVQHATGSSDGWSVSDQRGNADPWSLTVTATPLTSAAGLIDTTTRTIPAANLTLTTGAITALPGSDPTTGLTLTDGPLSDTPLAIISSGTSHRGTYLFTPTFSLHIPAASYRSNFTGQPGTTLINPYVTVLTITIA